MTERQVSEGLLLCNEIELLSNDVIVLESFAGELQKNSTTVIEFYSKDGGGAKMEALAPGLVKALVKSIIGDKNAKIGALQTDLKLL